MSLRSDLITAFAISGSALLIAILVETLMPLEKRRLSRGLGIWLQSVFLISSALVAWPLSALLAALDLHVLPPMRSWAGLWAIPILFVLTDFLTYWEHRFEHRFFWRVHKVHHSPTDIHAANTFGHPLQAIPMFFMIGLPMAFLNAGSLPLWASLASGFWVYYIHSPIDLNLAKLRWLLVDNHSHRIHHSTQRQHFDRNFANVFSVWDRLFGTTHQLQPGEWPTVGISEPPPANAVDYLLMPLRPGKDANLASGRGGNAQVGPLREPISPLAAPLME